MRPCRPVYEKDQDPDKILREFAAELNASGRRAVGMVQTGQCADASLSAVLVHTGEVLALAQQTTSPASGCKLDLGRLQDAAARVAGAMEAGADLVIVNRFGKRERDGKGLSQRDPAGAGRRYSRGDRGLKRELRRLDQIRRRDERETAL